MAFDLLKMPRRIILNGIDLVLKTLSPNQYDKAYEMVQSEADLGEDVGEDEFPTPTSLFSYLNQAHSFTLSDQATNIIRGLITVMPSPYSRCQEPILAGGLVICDTAIKNTIISDAIRLAIQLTSALEFQGVLADVFCTSPLVGLLQSEGFIVVARIPDSGHVKGQGWTDSLLLFRPLKIKEQLIKCSPSIQLIQTSGQNDLNITAENKSAKMIDLGEAVPVSLPYMVQKPILKYLPCSYSFRNGTKVIIRYACEADIPTLFSMYKSAAEQGQGFSSDEFTNMEIFRFYIIDHGHPIVAVDPQNSMIVLSFSLTPSTLCRSANPQLADSYLVVHQGYRKKGIGFDASKLLLRIAKDLGYAGLVTDVLCDNIVVMYLMKHTGFNIVGHIPKAVMGMDGQYNDIVICFKDLIDWSSQLAKL